MSRRSSMLWIGWFTMRGYFSNKNGSLGRTLFTRGPAHVTFRSFISVRGRRSAWSCRWTETPWAENNVEKAI
jgi:hypothetical protein